MLRYVLITPAKNEAEFIGLTIESVLRQTVKPERWVIVDDGSDDATGQIVAEHAKKHSWIELVRAPETGERHFGRKVDAFNRGYARLNDCEYEVIGNLDGDISFADSDYFEFLIKKFADNLRLGVCGTGYREGDLEYPFRFTSREDVFGACQMFRRDCFRAIGGYRALKTGGIDVIAVLDARAHGWMTRTFTEKACVHHRKVGSAQHQDVYARLLNEGRKDYLLGNPALWESCRGLYRMKSKPYIVGGALLITGYFRAKLSRVERIIPPDLMDLRKDEQIRRLKALVLHAFGASAIDATSRL